ncbi:MAG TPA: GxxExxY protein [Candidatus Angelobacter sp.]|jgi:GxxExxY protein|nr:GxxExxY protein [Candidatus Angelobacter sp.]
MSETAAAPKLRYEELTEKILGAAIEVHKTLGPGLLESAYEECLCLELNLRGLRFVRQITVPVSYKGINLDCGYKLDLLVENTSFWNSSVWSALHRFMKLNFLLT